MHTYDLDLSVKRCQQFLPKLQIWTQNMDTLHRKIAPQYFHLGFFHLSFTTLQYTVHNTSESRCEKSLKKNVKDDSRQSDAFQEAAVFDYKGISNPVSLSCFLYISV